MFSGDFERMTELIRQILQIINGEKIVDVI